MFNEISQEGFDSVWACHNQEKKMFTEISHEGFDYKTGVRVLLLAGRAKDGASNRRMFRISKDEDNFDKVYTELKTLALPGERIYSSASQRDVKKAAYYFKAAMLEAQYQGQEDSFFNNLNSKWVSALMSSDSKPRIMLWDLDSREEIEIFVNWIINEFPEDALLHTYETKNGLHVLTSRIDNRKIPTSLSKLYKTNAMMLLGY